MAEDTAADRHVDEVRRYFERQSRTWSQQYASGLIADRTERFLRVLRPAVPPRGDVLDIGCGSGEIARQAAVEGWRVTGCDLSQGMLSAASARPGAHVVTWVHLTGTDGRLPFADGRFDAVYSSSVLEYVSQVTTHLQEVARVLRPGGLYAATVPDMRHSVRVAELSKVKIAACRPLMALLQLTRWGPQYEHLLTSLNRWAPGQWVDRFRSAGLVPDDVPACSQPLLLLTARRAPRR